QAIIVGLSMSGQDAALLAYAYPQRIQGAVFIGPVSPFGERPQRQSFPWGDKLETTEGWAKHTKHYWLTNYEDWLGFFASTIVTEPHSTKQIDDIIEWGGQTTAQILIATYEADEPPSSPFSDAEKAKQCYARLTC